MRIFLDANVLFSATKSDGAVRRLLDLLIEAGHECWADGFVAEEARRNLAAKFPDGLPVLETLLLRLHTGPVHTPDSALEDGLPLPEKDRPVLAAAIRHGCEALVTGDRAHFGRLYGKAIHGVTIHTPRSIAETLDRKSTRLNSSHEWRSYAVFCLNKKISTFPIKSEKKAKFSTIFFNSLNFSSSDPTKRSSSYPTLFFFYWSCDL